MATLRGQIKDKNDRPLRDCEIALLDKKFRELCLVKSDEEGRFQIEAENRIYPYFYAVKNYGVDFLEFWGNHVDLTADFEMTVRIGKIEIYGMNCFQIKCPLTTLSVYFRPMSLTRHLCKEKDIAPELEKENIRVTINGAATEVLVINRVKEYAGKDGFLSGYLLQADTSNIFLSEKNVLFLQVYDKESDDIGEAMSFFSV